MTTQPHIPSGSEVVVTPPRAGWRNLRRDLAILTGLGLVAIGVGLGSNAFREDSLPLVYVSKTDRLQQSVARLAVEHPTNPLAVGTAPVSRAPPATEPELIDLARFHELVERGGIVLDARPDLFYRVGHVPGARSLSREKFATDYARLRDFLESHRREPLLVYCAGDECVDSHLVASALQKLGYAPVLIFAGGWEEWERAGLPEERL